MAKYARSSPRTYTDGSIPFPEPSAYANAASKERPDWALDCPKCVPADVYCRWCARRGWLSAEEYKKMQVNDAAVIKAAYDLDESKPWRPATRTSSRWSRPKSYPISGA